MSEIRVESLRRLEAVDADAWNALVPLRETAMVFQTWQWHRAWWQVFGEGKQLHLFAAKRGSQLLGLLALCQGADRTLRFVGHGQSDYLDVIGAVDPEVRAALWQAVLITKSRWRRMHLRYLPNESPTPNELQLLGLRCQTTQVVACPTLRVQHPSDVENVLAKKSVRRHHRWFQKQPDAAVEHLTTASEIEPYLDEFFAQHVRRWAGTKHPSLFCDERKRSFYRVAIQHLDGTGWLCFTRLTIAGRCVACHFGMRFGGRLLWYKPSFEIDLAKHSPGEAMIAELLTLVQREGLSELDFTVGEEAFKRRFTNHVRHNETAMLFRSTLDHLRSVAVRKAKNVARAVSGR